jgi:hypothetical protein
MQASQQMQSTIMKTVPAHTSEGIRFPGDIDNVAEHSMDVDDETEVCSVYWDTSTSSVPNLSPCRTQ